MEEVTRKLASIRLISEIRPIDGADNIELAIVDGWQCIVKKGEFKAGNPCIYFEIDSFLPIRPEFEFLRKSSYKKMCNKEGFRLKTIRLRGQISQGLVLRLDTFWGTSNSVETHLAFLQGILLQRGMSFEEVSNHMVGLDVTDLLGVIKYEPPIPACLAGKVKGNFPSFIRKTDLERVQNIWDKVKYDDQLYEVTIKLDGTSCTFYLNDGNFGVCSRNLELKEDENNVYWKMARKYNIEEFLRKLGKNIALQGEIIGEGIQCNPEGIKGQEFYLFDIWDIDNQRYFRPEERMFIIGGKCINHVPICRYGYDEISPVSSLHAISLMFFDDLGKLLDFANGKSLHAKMREGLVFKSYESDIRFKVISNEYLLKNEV